MYNFLKYKHNWKKCPHCGGKIKRDKAFIYNRYYQCQRESCQKESLVGVFRNIPVKRRFYPKGNFTTQKIRLKFRRLIQKYREYKLREVDPDWIVKYLRFKK